MIYQNTQYYFKSYTSMVEKLIAKYDTEITSILDPLVGTGNLGYSIINYLERDIKLFGVDNIINSISSSFKSA
mgnify:CR=1 FL=1